MDEILSAIESLSLELQAADQWAMQAKLEKIKQMIIEDALLPSDED